MVGIHWVLWKGQWVIYYCDTYRLKIEVRVGRGNSLLKGRQRGASALLQGGDGLNNGLVVSKLRHFGNRKVQWKDRELFVNACEVNCFIIFYSQKWFFKFLLSSHFSISFQKWLCCSMTEYTSHVACNMCTGNIGYNGHPSKIHFWFNKMTSYS